jgi:hypothetical protein
MTWAETGLTATVRSAVATSVRTTEYKHGAGENRRMVRPPKLTSVNPSRAGLTKGDRANKVAIVNPAPKIAQKIQLSRNDRAKPDVVEFLWKTT